MPVTLTEQLLAIVLASGMFWVILASLIIS